MIVYFLIVLVRGVKVFKKLQKSYILPNEEEDMGMDIPELVKVFFEELISIIIFLYHRGFP